MARVVRDQNQVFSEGVGSDLGVEFANRRALALVQRLDLSVVVCRLARPLKIGQAQEEVIYEHPPPIKGLYNAIALQQSSYECSYNYPMELEWDADKAALNLQKHGISFEDAALVFYDHGRIETYDGRENYNEDRWATIGVAYFAVLYVVYTIRHEETVRLISARKANASERKQYREANP